MSKVLFVIQQLGFGGSTTSLLNMLELLDKSGHRADLFIMKHGGAFMDRAAVCANILPEDTKLASSICNRNSIKRYGINGLINRCYVSLKYKLKNPRIVLHDIYKSAAELIKGYDVVISYQENIATDFTQYIPSKKRIAWVHTMYDSFTINMSYREVLDTYLRFDDIVCVAPAAVDVFKKRMPSLADRVSLISNPLNVEMIKQKACCDQNDIADDLQNVIISVGRLSPEKQYDYAIKAAKKLYENGFAFKWFIVGEGIEKAKLEELINRENLQDIVVLLGSRQNPYPLIAKADVLVISSVYEAQPMVANEAFVLGVPVITTDYPAAKTLINHGQNGIICKTSVDGIYSAVNNFMSNKDLSAKLTKGARNFHYDNDSILEKILDLFVL